MKLIYIRQQNFHLADEKEQDDILTHYEKKKQKNLDKEDDNLICVSNYWSYI